ncbi:MAG: hypothetical protein J6K86_00225 [Clostridia bacterium]|nr:hypothetical protein [Clostridia bacterium]
MNVASPKTQDRQSITVTTARTTTMYCDAFTTPVKERENEARREQDKKGAAFPTGVYYA